MPCSIYEKGCDLFLEGYKMAIQKIKQMKDHSGPFKIQKYPYVLMDNIISGALKINENQFTWSACYTLHTLLQ